jgi:hypothetical protein
VTDAAGVSVTTPCSITIAAPPTITCPGSLVTAGSPYTWTGTFNTNGGTGALNCAWTSGSAPSGLTLAPSTCTVTGTVTATTSLCITVTDSLGATASTCCTLQVVTPPQIQCPTTFAGTANVALGNGAGIQLPSTGGSGTKTFTLVSVTPSTFSPALTISSTGLVTGTPTAAGSYNVCYNYTDPSIAPSILSRCCTLTVVGSAPALTCPGPFSGEVGVATSFTWTTTALGAESLVYTVTTGSVPANMTLNAATGVISGTPSAQQTSTSVCITATDAALTKSTASCCSITIIPGPTFSCATISAVSGVAFTYPLTTSGGTAPYTCALSSFNGTGGWATVTSGCVVTGTPTQTGNFSLCTRITDAATSSLTQCCTIRVRSAPILNCPSQTTLAVSQAYKGQLTVSGGSRTSVVYAFVSTTMSAAFTVVSSSGSWYMQGTPAAADVGARSFCFSYTDSWLNNSAPIQKCCPVNVASNGPQITCPATPTTVDVGFTTYFTFTVANSGSGSLLYAVDSSNALTVASFASASSRVATVTPNVTGLGVTLCVNVRDAALVTMVLCCPVDSNPALALACPGAGGPFAINTGSAWSGTWLASGGTGSYTYSSSTLLVCALCCWFVTGLVCSTGCACRPA